MNSLAAIIEIKNLHSDNELINLIFEQKIFSELVFFHNLKEDDIENYFENNFYSFNKEKKFVKVKSISYEFSDLIQSLESYYFILINSNDERSRMRVIDPQYIGQFVDKFEEIINNE